MEPDPLVQSFGFVTNSFGDLITRIESPGRENCRKNTAGPNEFTDFEKFKVEHRRRPKTISLSNSAQHPGTGITLQLIALRVMYCGGPALSRATGRAGKICIGARKRPLRLNFSIFRLQRKFDFCDEIFEILESWTDPPCSKVLASLQIRLAI